jgi:acetyl esterase/lipase
MQKVRAMSCLRTRVVPIIAALLMVPALGALALSRSTAPTEGQGIPQPIMLWDKEVPRATGTSNEDRPAIYPYLPDPAKNTGAAVLVCPGGGNQTRCADFEGVLIAQWFKERGIAAFILRYRIQPLYGAAEARLDTQRGVQFLRAHAERFKISPDRIGVIGFSAGASNICAATFNALPAKPDSTDPVERVSSSPNFLIPIYGSAPLPEATESPLPPTFMFCTAEDAGGLGGMVTLYTNLRKKGVPTEVHFFEKGPHGVGFAQGDPVLGEYPNLLLNWLRLKGFLTGEKRMALEGLVKVDGEPLPRGTIIFHPLERIGAPPVVGYVFNTGKVRGEYQVAASVGAVAGKYRVEVRQDAVHWLSNANNPMTARLKQMKSGTAEQKLELADYARKRNLEPTIEGQRVYRKLRPTDANEILIEIGSGGKNRIDLEVFSK